VTPEASFYKVLWFALSSDSRFLWETNLNTVTEQFLYKNLQEKRICTPEDGQLDRQEGSCTQTDKIIYLKGR
jgi:hypothetical protein